MAKQQKKVETLGGEKHLSRLLSLSLLPSPIFLLVVELSLNFFNCLQFLTLIPHQSSAPIFYTAGLTTLLCLNDICAKKCFFVHQRKNYLVLYACFCSFVVHKFLETFAEPFDFFFFFALNCR